MTWDARHEEGLQEWRAWDQRRSASYMSQKQIAQHPPRVRGGKIVGAKKKAEREVIPAVLIAPIDEPPMKTCFCGSSFSGRSQYRECFKCQNKRWMKKHPNFKCLDCDKLAINMCKRCSRCHAMKVSSKCPPCACGRPAIAKKTGLCKLCSHKALMNRDPIARANYNARKAAKMRRKYAANPERYKVKAKKRYDARKAA